MIMYINFWKQILQIKNIFLKFMKKLLCSCDAIQTGPACFFFFFCYVHILAVVIFSLLQSVVLDNLGILNQTLYLIYVGRSSSFSFPCLEDISYHVMNWIMSLIQDCKFTECNRQLKRACRDSGQNIVSITTKISVLIWIIRLSFSNNNNKKKNVGQNLNRITQFFQSINKTYRIFCRFYMFFNLVSFLNGKGTKNCLYHLQHLHPMQHHYHC